MKRLLSIVLSLALCLGVVFMAFPAGAASSDDLKFTISQGEVTVIGCDLYASGTLVVPRTYRGLPVTKIGESAFENCRGLTSVIIPEGVTSIGDKAFYNCRELSFAALPEGLETIGAEAFYGCSLAVLSIPTTVTFIGEDAFEALDEKYGDYEDRYTLVIYIKDLAAWCNITFGNMQANPLRWAQEVYLDNEILTELVFPESVTELNSYAFAGFSPLTSVTVHSGVTRIGNGAFVNCPNLEGIWVDDRNPKYSSDSYGVLFTKDQKELVQAPPVLEHYRIPQGVQVIRQQAFRGSELSTVIIPDSVVSIGAFAFAYTDLRDVYFCGDIPVMYEAIDESRGWGEYGPFYFSDEPTIHCLTDARGTTYHQDFCGCEWIDYSCEVEVKQEDHLCLEYTYDNNATCTADGTERGVCLVCGELYVRTAKGTAGHQLVDAVSNNDATCRRDGTKTGTCAHCGEVLTVTDEGTQLEHNTTQCSEREATCERNTYRELYCTTCDSYWLEDDEGTATGHSFTHYVSDGNGSCISDGTEVAKCDRCNATQRRTEMGTKAHRYEDGLCIFCGRQASDSERAVLTGSLTTFTQGATQLELWSETEVKTFSVSADCYTLEDLQPGSYQLTVSKSGHVSHTYSLPLRAGENFLDLELHRPGDINGDGKINTGDVSKSYAHAQKSALLTDYELLCADINGDGKVNTGDVSKAYAHAKRTALLW